MFDGADITRLAAMRRCLAGIGRTFQIPQPFEKLTVFENLLVGATLRRRQTAARGRRSAAPIFSIETGLIATRQRAGRAADAARAQAAGTGARARHRAEAPAARRDRRRTDRRRMPRAGRDHPDHPRAPASPSSGSSTSLHALNSVVERLLVLDFGKVIGIGEPADDHGVARGARDLSGDRGLTWRCSKPGPDRPLRRLPGAVRRRHRAREGETVAIIGANGAGKTTLLRSIAGRAAQRRRTTHPASTGGAIGALPAGRDRAPSASRMVPEGRQAVPLADRRGKPADRQLRPQGRRPWSLDAVYELFPVLKERRSVRPPRCPAASSRWWRSAAR